MNTYTIFVLYIYMHVLYQLPCMHSTLLGNGEESSDNQQLVTEHDKREKQVQSSK